MSPIALLFIALTYLLGLPIILRLIGYAHKKIRVEKAAAKAPKTIAGQKNLPKPIWPTIRARLAFTMKDTRQAKIIGSKENNGPQKRIIFFGLWITGFIVWLAAFFTGQYKLAIIGFILFWTAIIYGYRSSKDVLETRKSILRRMFEVGNSKGLLTNEYADNPEAVIKVLKWRDYVKPEKVEYQVRTEFSSNGEEAFLQQFNQIFGSETAWVPTDNPEENEIGWNYEEGKVTINAVPPLPRRADWDEHYVLSEGIAWSFFPIALGVEHGVELLNPKTNVVENVIGFDVSGEQPKVGEKAGLKVSDIITTSPMVFIGGGTGGGKSLATDTPIFVYDED